MIINRNRGGWTTEQISMLETIFDGVVYKNTTAQDIADALIASLRGGEPETYSVTYNLTGCTSDTDVDSVDAGDPFSATITIMEGWHTLYVSCTMGGEDVTVMNNEINISSVTGNIVVTGIAQRVEPTPDPEPVELTATYSGSSVPAGTPLDEIGIVVKCIFDDESEETLTYETDYTLSGTIVAGQSNTITVTGAGDYAGLDPVTVQVQGQDTPTVVTSAEADIGSGTDQPIGYRPTSLTITLDRTITTQEEPNKIVMTAESFTDGAAGTIHSFVAENGSEGWKTVVGTLVFGSVSSPSTSGGYPLTVEFVGSAGAWTGVTISNVTYNSAGNKLHWRTANTHHVTVSYEE